MSRVGLPSGSYMKRPPERDRSIGTGAWVGMKAPTSVPGLKKGPLPFRLQSPSLSHTAWVLFSCPPHEGLIPLTSTEAPVMYPLSSDAKNATTSATSSGSPMCPNGIIAVTCKETLTWVEVSFMDLFIPHYVHIWNTYCLHRAQQSPSETSSDRLPSTHSLPCPSLSLAFSGSWALQ